MITLLKASITMMIQVIRLALSINKIKILHWVKSKDNLIRLIVKTITE